MQENPPASYGELLRRYRADARLTQEALAARAGLSTRGVQDLERGVRRSPYPGTTRRLAEALSLGGAQRAALQDAANRPGSDSRSSVVSSLSGALPTHFTSFVGRVEAMASLGRLLDPSGTYTPPTRLVTLTGAGGCGKTRLAVEVANCISDAFPDGVCFADLSMTTDPAHVPAIVLSALGGHESPRKTQLESLLRRLRGRRLLLVLDNCEHLVDACAELVDRLLSASSGLRVLATSRAALRVDGEIAWRVPSLAVPESSDDLEPHRALRYAAVRLFVDRARQVEQDFSLTADNAAAVAGICRRLDGIPLALEFAAARTAAMSVLEIAARLDDCFHLLTAANRTALERQRTLRATIDWSHNLLSPGEQTLFRRLAVFAGGWTLEAAEAVCAAEPLPRSDIMNPLLQLVEQSLVTVEAQPGRTRYRFLETVRAYAAECLEASGEAAAVQARHRAWCLEFAEYAAEALTGPDQVSWFRLITSEHANIRAALDACGSERPAAEAELRLAAAMGRFWFPRQPAEGRFRLTAALEREPSRPSSARAAARYWHAMFELYFGDPALGRDLAAASLADARAIGTADRAAWALHALIIATDEYDAPNRQRLVKEGLALARAACDKHVEALLLAKLGAVAAEAGDLERARVLLEESEGLARSIGDAWPRITSSAQLGWLDFAQDRLDDSELHFRTLLDLGEGLGGFHTAPGLLGLGQVSLRRGEVDRSRTVYHHLLIDLRDSEPHGSRVAEALVFLASVEAAAGLSGRAQRLLGANEAWHAARGGAGRIWSPNIRGPLRRGLVPIPSKPTDAALVRARAEGRSMSLDEAVVYAIEAVDLSPPEPGNGGGEWTLAGRSAQSAVRGASRSAI